MGTMKIWDGTTWQLVAQNGPAGPPGMPPAGATSQVLTKRSAADFDTQWSTPSNVPGSHGSTHAWNGTDPIPGLTDGAWLVYTPNVSTDQGSGGMTPGTGGFNWGTYRMIAPYTMALRTRWQWGSAGGNGGTGSFAFGLPAGYSTANDMPQTMSNLIYRPPYSYMGMCYLTANDVWLRPYAPNAATIQDVVGSQIPVHTDGAAPHPPSWYPNGYITCFGVISVQQRW